MLDVTYFLYLLPFVLIIWIAVTKLYQTKSVPPGPWGIPVFGIMPFLNAPPHIKFQEYYKKYGNICSFYVGQSFVVLLSDYELIREALVKQADNFSGRPDSFPFRVFPEDNGIVTSEGYLFKQYKSFIISTLKDFGAVRTQFEIVVQNNAESFINYLDKLKGQTIRILEPLGLSIAQTYCKIILGKKFDFDDPLFKKLIGLCYQEQRCYVNGARIFLPWTRKIPVIKTYVGEDEILDVKKNIKFVFNDIIEESVKTYVEGSRQSFIHCWLTEEMKRKEGNPDDKVFSRHSLIHNMDMVFGAGYETTTTTLRWAFLFFLKHPHIQEKIIDEIDKVIGQDRFPSLHDEKFLPYTLASIQEVHRCATIGPLGIPHKNKEEATLGNYRIPRSSNIYVNAYAVHTNPTLFPQPHEFKPERFIDSEGKFCKSNYIISFSMGKRQCPGEHLAHTEIFLYITYILQKYRLQKANIEDFLETGRSESVSAVPIDYKMRFVKRW